MNDTALTLYFDGACPFCVAEMTRLRDWDERGRLRFIDIAATGFDPTPLGVSLNALNLELHGWTASGARLTGIDCMIEAYGLVGHAWIVAPLRVQALRPLFRGGYRLFARHRQRVSRWLGLEVKHVCVDGRCVLDADRPVKRPRTGS